MTRLSRERTRAPHRIVHSLVRAFSLWRCGAQTGFVDLRGVSIAWAALGKPGGRPLLMVHGLRGEAIAMLPLAREMAARGYYVVSLDMPGHGRTAPLTEALTIPLATQVLAEFIEAFAFVERPAIAGHSMGGWFTALLALTRSELCGPIALLASAGVFFVPPPREILLPTRIAEARESLALLFARPPRVPSLALYFSTRRPVATDDELLDSALEGGDLLEGRLGALPVPATVIWGREDRLIPPDAGRRLAAEIPGHDFHELADAGHMLIWERSRRVAEIMAAFFEGRSRNGTRP